MATSKKTDNTQCGNWDIDQPEPEISYIVGGVWNGGASFGKMFSYYIKHKCFVLVLAYW